MPNLPKRHLILALFLLAIIAVFLSFPLSSVLAQNFIFGTEGGQFVIKDKDSGEVKMRIDSEGKLIAPFKKPPSTGDNFILNPSFELDTDPNKGFVDNWNTNFEQTTCGANCIYTVETSSYQSGQKSASLKTNGTSGAVASIASDLFDVEPGRTYQAFLDYNCETNISSGISIRVIYYDGATSNTAYNGKTGSDTNLLTSGSCTRNESGWNNINTSFTVPTNCGAGGNLPCTRARVVISNAPASTTKLFLDNVKVGINLNPASNSTQSASFISAGTFGGQTGGGDYIFPGKLGVNNANPTVSGFSLDVNGNARFTGTVTAANFVGSGGSAVNAADVSAGTFGANSGGGNFLFPASLTVDTNTLFVDSVSDRVGIGTTSPAQKLHVEGQCVTGDTLLKRRRKKRGENGEWIYYWEDIRIDQIKPGDEILTLDEEGEEFVISRVKKLMQMGTKEIWKLTTATGKQIRTTANHPYLVASKVDNGRLAVFIDAANFEISCRVCHLDYNYREIIKAFFGQSNDKRIFRYYSVDRTSENQGKFFTWLKHQKVKIITKPLKVIKQRHTDDLKKANFDVEISLDAALLKDKYDTLILFSGDADFVYLVKQLQAAGKKVVVISPWKSTAKELREQTDLYLNLKKMPFVNQKVNHKNRPSFRAPKDSLSTAELILTQVSPFVKGKWVKVKEIKVGQMIATLGENGKPIMEKVVAIEKLPPEEVYDIEIENTHNFLANGIVAHNTYISGSVGIGTTSPSNKLEIVGSGWSNTLGGDLRVTGSNSIGAAITLNATGTSGRSYSWLSTAAGAGAGAGKLALWDNTAQAYRMAIDSSGNVGIGTTDPGSYKLNVAGTANISTSLTTPLIIGSSSLALRPAANSTTALQLQNAAGTSILNVDTSSGYVGIGTTGPGAKLDVVGRIDSSQTIRSTGYSDPSSGAGIELLYIGGIGTIQSYDRSASQWKSLRAGGLDIRFEVTSAEKMRIDSAGNVGIGTTSPGAKLDVAGNAYLPQIFINRNAGAGRGISWYSPSYTSWSEYMCQAGQTGCGPTANLTAPSGSLVTSWALRSFIENASGYGWTFESGTSTGQPTIVAEIRSSDGSARFGGTVNAVAGFQWNGQSLDSRYAYVGGSNATGTWPINISGTAAHLAGGSAGSIPYQSAANTTAMLSPGTAGYLLQTNGASAPSWVQATDANIGSTIVKRDASGNFSAGTITANLNGTATNATNATYGRYVYDNNAYGGGLGWKEATDLIVKGANNANACTLDGNCEMPGNGIWNSSGNVGIGTTSPLAKLHVIGECVVGETLLPIKRRKKRKKHNDEKEEFEDLLVPIKDIQPGDLVASLDEASGKIVYRPIKKLLNKGFQKVVKITTEDNRFIETTLNHPYLTENHSWVKVSQLKVGDRIAVPKKKAEKVSFAFIDATNIIYGSGHSGWQMDFEKLARYLRTRFGVSRLLYYAGVDQENFKQLGFYEKLQTFGFELRLVPVKIFKDGRKKADVDSRMTFEMMRDLKEYDRALVMTGDGDFYWILEYLCQNKELVKLIACSRSTAKGLKQLFKHNFTDLDNLKHFLSRQPQKTGHTLLKNVSLGVMDEFYRKAHDLSSTGIKFVKIASIEETGRKEVYDIEVEGTHNFVGNDILAHNTSINSTANTANIKGLEISQSGAVSGTGYGLYVTKTGASTTNVAGYFSASGGTNNYGLIVENGNVGIGTTGPVTSLEIVTTSPDDPRGFTLSQYSSDTGAGQLNVRKARGTEAAPTAVLSGDILMNVQSRGYDGAAFGIGPRMRAIVAENWSGTAHGSHLVLETVPIGSTTVTERVRIDAAGNVGIGTTSPQAKLDIGGSSSTISNSAGDITLNAFSNLVSFAGDTIGNFGQAQGGSGTASSPTYSFSTNTNTGIYLAASNNLRFVTGGSDRVTIDSSGNVGIGTTNPGAKLEIASGNIRTKSSGDSGYGFEISTSGDAGTWGSSKIIFKPVGADTSYPAMKLVVDTYDNTQTYRSSGFLTRVGGNNAAQFATDASDLYIDNIRNSSNTIFRMGSSFSEKMRIDSTGNVGIGTTGPLYKLHVVAPGGFGAENPDGTSQAGNVPIIAQSNSTVIGILNSNSRQVFALNIEGNAGTSTARGYPVFYDKHDGTWRPSIVLRTGNVGIGTTEPTEKLDVVGNAKISGTIRGATYGFGGIYRTDCGGGCVTPNPFTGTCSCPNGFTAQNLGLTADGGPTWRCTAWCAK